MPTTLEKLQSFGEKISQGATKDATEILNHGLVECGFLESNVFPGNEGEVMVTFYPGPSYYIEVLIESPNVFEVFYEVESEEKLSRDCESIAEVTQLLSKINGEISTQAM